MTKTLGRSLFQVLALCVLASGAAVGQAAIVSGFQSAVSLAAPQITSLGGAALSVVRTEMFSGTTPQSYVLPISVSSAGTVTVTLTDLAWPERLASLSFAATDSSHVLGTLGAPGVLTFAMAAAGTFSAEVFGTPAGAGSIGLFSLNVSFAPVPLPAASGLLLSALALLGAMFALRRRPLAAF